MLCRCDHRPRRIDDDSQLCWAWLSWRIGMAELLPRTIAKRTKQSFMKDCMRVPTLSLFLSAITIGRARFISVAPSGRSEHHASRQSLGAFRKASG